MMKDNFLAELQFLRNKIDDIDNRIVDLIQSRLEIVAEVRSLKVRHSLKPALFIDPFREYKMIENLYQNSSLSRNMVYNLWRNIISYANSLEQKLRIKIFNPNEDKSYYYIAQSYYCGNLEVFEYKNYEEFLSGKEEIFFFAEGEVNFGDFDDEIRVFCVLQDSKEKNYLFAGRVGEYKNEDSISIIDDKGKIKFSSEKTGKVVGKIPSIIRI